MAKIVRNFWSDVERIVEYKTQLKLEEKRKQAFDQHLNLIVTQTEKYSQLLVEGSFYGLCANLKMFVSFLHFFRKNFSKCCTFFH